MGIFDRISSWFGRLSGIRVAAAEAWSAFSVNGVGGWALRRRAGPALLMSYTQHPALFATVRRRAEAIAPAQWRLYKRKGGGSARALMRRGIAAVDDPKIRTRLRREIVRAERAQTPLTVHAQRAALTQALLETGQLEELAEHEALDLLDRPGEDMAGFELLELISKYLDMVGHAPVLKARAGRKPVALIPIVPTLTSSGPTGSDPHWTFNTMSGASVRYPKRDVLRFRIRDLLDPVTGLGVGVAEVLADELETDELLAKMAKSRAYNRGVPDAFLGLKGQGVSDEAVKRFAAQLEQKHRGPDKAGQIEVLNREFQLGQIGHTFVEGQHVQQREFYRDQTTTTTGTPPEIIGVLKNANRSTIAASGQHMWRYSTMPQLERIRFVFQIGLIEADYGDDLFLDYLSMEPTDDEAETGVMKALPGAFTRNEIRARGGVPPRPDGDEYYAQPGAGPSVPVKGGGPKQATEDDEKKTPEEDPPAKKEDPNAVPEA